MRTDVVIVGAGIAGLMAALKVAPLQAVVICKNHLGSGAATDWAQGGIAAAMGPDDSPVLHSLDTQKAGAGIANRGIVDILTRDAPAQIEQLLELGAHFDRTTRGDLALGQEAAHNRRRIVRAGGDATGHEILRTLVAAVRATPSIRVLEETRAVELLTDGTHARGIIASDVHSGTPFAIHADATILATGGIGHLYSRTTNPPEACGDGIAIAARAGALLADMEFVQFHPTALDTGADPMPLATEALRGEGAVIINASGKQFMRDVHKDADLAPRDIVARAIFAEGKNEPVFLDTRAAIGAAIEQRFPTVAAACRKAGIDPILQPIPIAPAAHYHMGGVAVDQWGRTSVSRLWAAGEVSASGMHGANRLASNSLLEALGFATRVATAIKNTTAPSARPINPNVPIPSSYASATELAAIAEVRTHMYQNVGLVRNAPGLLSALETLTSIGQRFANPSLELRNLLDVGTLVTTAALKRQESRGSHYRSDYPDTLSSFAKRFFSTLEGAA
ncbi:MAG: L-aspartate oxidase [Candidatus Baltobacteraceae bacterium]